MSIESDERLVECILKVGKMIGTFDGMVPDEVLRGQVLIAVVNHDPNIKPMVDLVQAVVETLLHGDIGWHAAAVMSLISETGKDTAIQMTVPNHGNWELICRKVLPKSRSKLKRRGSGLVEPIMVKRMRP